MQQVLDELKKAYDSWCALPWPEKNRSWDEMLSLVELIELFAHLVHDQPPPRVDSQ